MLPRVKLRANYIVEQGNWKAWPVRPYLLAIYSIAFLAQREKENYLRRFAELATPKI